MTLSLYATCVLEGNSSLCLAIWWWWIVFVCFSTQSPRILLAFFQHRTFTSTVILRNETLPVPQNMPQPSGDDCGGSGHLVQGSHVRLEGLGKTAKNFPVFSFATFEVSTALFWSVHFFWTWRYIARFVFIDVSEQHSDIIWNVWGVQEEYCYCIPEQLKVKAPRSVEMSGNTSRRWHPRNP
jgi:hypothetical protein